MSRRDPRKALALAIPGPMRQALVRTTAAHLPLAYLLRQSLRRALDAGRGWETTVEPGGTRAILLQLSPEEQARLDMWRTARDVPADVAILSLVQRQLQDEGLL
ncbi:hypothetical protein [Ponticoccus litoralis]|uniref:Uncharacterized protein n=1 Tax=Ponticoccus litoralis TaxID=422297 RepID=A0AAW9SKM3_9RHOB